MDTYPLDVIKAKAKENLKVSTGGSNPRPFQPVGKVEKVHTDEELAKLAQVSDETIRMARIIKR